MRTIAITPPYFYAGEADAIVAALDERGFWRVHIRKPNASANELRELLVAIPMRLRNRISLHDHHNIAIEFGIGGVHLNRRNPLPPAGWHGITSRSIHSLEEIAGMTDDYAFLSPIFPSISKPGYHNTLTLESLSPHLNPRIFALGGVTPAKLPVLDKAGFGGAAMLGAAWRHELDTAHFRLQFITHPTPRHNVVEGAKEALHGGCRWIQLRHKEADSATLLSEAKAIALMCRNHGATFIIDDHAELVTAVGADGVHLGKNDMPVEEARATIGPNKIIGATANTFSDLETAARAGADYIGLGPFRFTQTKKNLSPILGPEGYRSIMDDCRNNYITLPVVAIGGITDADIPGIMDTGISGIALSSSILSANDPARQTAITLDIINHSING